jgi:hypothetical protein
MRIASPSTEIICALSFGDDLVGRSRECDHPEWVKRLPALTEPTLPTANELRDRELQRSASRSFNVVVVK